MNEKVLGYVLLTIGILTILFSGLSVYRVFTKKSRPVQLFNFKGIGLDTSKMLGDSLPSEASQLLQQNRSKPQETEIIPPQLINDTSNVFAHIILMGFIASIGAKLANLGVMLVRPIVVKLKTNETLN